jgi:hypothetical protein
MQDKMRPLTPKHDAGSFFWNDGMVNMKKNQEQEINVEIVAFLPESLRFNQSSRT